MKASILVVDDERYVRDLLERVLSRKEYVVETAEGGEAALARLETQRYDLVLTDVVMPGIDGFELLRRVKSLYPTTKVIVLTGYARKQSISDFLLYGADEYLSKPFQVQALLEAVDRAFGLPTDPTPARRTH